MVAQLSGGEISGAVDVMGYAAEGAGAREALSPLVDAQGWVLRDSESGLALDIGAEGLAVARDVLAARINSHVVAPMRKVPDAPHGATTLMLAELPVMEDILPTAPVVVAAAAGASAGWRRAALFTVEGGSGAAVSAGATAPAATLGVTLAPLVGGTAMLFDENAVLDVELLSEAMTLTEASDEAMLRGANACLVGREVVQFGRAEQTGERSWRLSRLLRGRRGTEWAMADHGASEPFLLIEAERLAAVPASAVHVGETTAMLAIGIGDAEPAEASIAVSGEALMPPSPAHVRIAWIGDGSAELCWVRRSRAGWAWRDGVDAPLGEESERYRVDLFDGDELARSVETTGPVWIYDAVMQAADAGAGHALPLRAEIRQVGTFAVGRSAVVMLNP